MNRAMLICCYLTLAALLPASTWAEADIDPRAMDLVQAAGERLRSSDYYETVVTDTIDEVREDGQKIQYSHRRSARVNRPDNLLVLRTTGDLAQTTFWKDGATVTVADDDEKVYAQVDDPGTIDEMMDLLLDGYGVPLPLADLLSARPGKVLADHVRTAEYVGLHQVKGVACHHLAFTQDTIDWQAWVEAGETPTLRKFLITYKHQPGQPQYTLILEQTKALDALSSESFHFEPPTGYDRIELTPVADTKEATAE